VSFPLPTGLSPSKVSSFKECALAFRFSAIDHLPEPPSPWAVKGTLVHRALELLFWELDPGQRTIEAALYRLERAWVEAHADPEFIGLGLSADDQAAFLADAETLVRNEFVLEDPNQVRVIGTELWLEAQIGGLTLRGIIDRLELDGDGELVVTDYKTGRAPGTSFEQSRLGGVHFYAFLCEQVFGRRPARVQLLHLREPLAISTEPSEQSLRGLRGRALAIWSAVERACEREDFRPRPSRLCDFCAYKAYCPAWGGDPALALEVSRAPVEAAATAAS
jgi:putative RecB family exonuclease